MIKFIAIYLGSLAALPLFLLTVVELWRTINTAVLSLL